MPGPPTDPEPSPEEKESPSDATMFFGLPGIGWKAMASQATSSSAVPSTVSLVSDTLGGAAEVVYAWRDPGVALVELVYVAVLYRAVAESDPVVGLLGFGTVVGQVHHDPAPLVEGARRRPGTPVAFIWSMRLPLLRVWANQKWAPKPPPTW
ncbi:hypothetical protein ACWGCI_01940 [Streptomyces sp. NPDC054949]